MPAANTDKPVKWYEIKALDNGDGAKTSSEVYIYGNIGDRWDVNGVIAADLVRELAALEVDTIVVRINSYGGSVPDGLAIFNALKRHSAAIDVQIDGVAISCAGYIAMAGDTITMAENAMLMIHAPWGFAMGNSAELRDIADMLDKYAQAMSTSYAGKSGKSLEDCLALLTDGKDHWYTAEEAKAEGFCDTVGPEVAIAAGIATSFNLTRFSQPAAAAAIPKEANMPAATPAATTTATPATPATPAAPAFARNKEMNEQLLAAFKPFLAVKGVSELQTEMLADPAITVEAANAKLLDLLGKDASPANPSGASPRVETITDEADKIKDAVVQALLARAAIRNEKGEVIRADSANPYRGYRLIDLARASLERGKVKTVGMMPMEVVGAAFTQSTSDFPVLLENTMHKALQAAYAVAALTWKRFCNVGSVSDFRAHNRYRVGSLSNLDAVNELGEFKNKTIPDGEKSSITAGTKGNIINLSRQSIINDDLGAFLGLSASLGRAAARTIENDVYTLLGLNAGLGPVMGDGQTLFHATHNNITTGAAISMAALDLDRVALASQKDVGGNDYLDLMAAVLLVPLSLGGTSRGIIGAEYDPDTTGKLQKPNIVKNLVRDVVDTPRLTGTRRYMFADPGEAPVLEVAFLDGAQDPYLEVQDGFDVDGARYKVRLDFGTAAIDYRGAVTNAGQ